VVSQGGLREVWTSDLHWYQAGVPVVGHKEDLLSVRVAAEREDEGGLARSEGQEGEAELQGRALQVSNRDTFFPQVTPIGRFRGGSQ
jgi:hypothetical protein